MLSDTLVVRAQPDTPDWPVHRESALPWRQQDAANCAGHRAPAVLAQRICESAKRRRTG